MAAITLRSVRKAFGRTEVIKGVDLDLDDGAFTALVGPSGCGKSTLLRLIAGLEEASGGDILIGGVRVNDVPPARRGIAMVFQSYALYPHMTVYDNMAFGLKLAKQGRQAIRARVLETARILRIEPLLDRKPRQLSGGQRQRVAIGRAIVRAPQVFLFDEPLSNLDAALRVQMRLELARLKAELRATMVYVTHDQVEAMTLADSIVVLNEGRVEQAGPPLDLYHHPRNLFVAGFIGSPQMNFLAAEAVAASAGAVTVALPGGTRLAVPADAAGVQPGDRLTLGIRPEHLRPGGGGDAEGAEAAGRIAAVERLGSETLLYLDLETAAAEGERATDRAAIVLRLEGDGRARTGDLFRFGIPAEACHLFGKDGLALARGPHGSKQDRRDAGPATFKCPNPFG